MNSFLQYLEDVDTLVVVGVIYTIMQEYFEESVHNLVFLSVKCDVTKVVFLLFFQNEGIC